MGSGPHTSRDAGQVCKECPEPPLTGERRCKACKAAHNARERERRAEFKRKRRCWACAKPAVKDESGAWLSTCQAHRGTGWRSAG